MEPSPTSIASERWLKDIGKRGKPINSTRVDRHKHAELLPLPHVCTYKRLLQPFDSAECIPLRYDADLRCQKLNNVCTHTSSSCMQVTNLAAMGTGNKRYKCKVSDGAGSMEAVLGSEAAKLAAAGDLNEGGIFTMQDYVVNVINDAQKLVVTGKVHLRACRTSRL